jgi:2-amino-4-hydroxy-6-hydroxymethyldihydropteridine diphosphokinase
LHSRPDLVVRRAYLSLGTNVGDRYEHLASAIPFVVDADEHRISKVYETEPIGGVAQNDFWNLVIELTTSASAYQLLERARRAEAAAGRTREVHWGPRTLDVDVLLVGDEVLDGPELTIPHPRLYERAFVLVPLAELAPELVSDEQRAGAVGSVRELGTLQSLH